MPGDLSLAEEFAEFDREVAVSEVRLKRDICPDALLESYLRHCDATLRRAKEGRAGFPARLVTSNERSEVERLAELCRGPEPAPR